MRILLGALGASLLAACGAVDTSNTVAPEVDKPSASALTVFTGGTIYTGNGMDTVSSVTVDSEGTIIAVTPPESDDWAGAEITTIDLGGAFMYPGFVDSHAHLLGIGQRELTLNLEGTASVAELVDRIQREVDGLPAGQILYGRGWIETGWPEGRMPMAADLDPISPDNPVILGRSDGHALVANSAALAAANITAATPDVAGGQIERDAAGQATGILIDNAMAAVMQLLSAPDEGDLIAAYVVGAEEYSRRGWAGVHNMSVNPAHAALLQRLDLEGRLPLRLHNAFDEDGFAVAASRQYETDTITNRAVKLYMDGALGSRGALLIEPYADRPGSAGLSLLEPERLTRLMQDADEAQVQLAMHAIGDLANRRILDTFEAGDHGEDLRWRIEHTQILHPDDIARVAQLGLIASMQPSHAIGDLKFAPARLGMQRLFGAYAWQSLLMEGAKVIGGSDAPVEAGTPQIEFYAAVARKDLEGASGDGWHPEEALSRTQALALFTSASAYAAFLEDRLGTIEVGKIADFSVFDRDFMTVPEAEILDANAVMTVVQGEIVYNRIP